MAIELSVEVAGLDAVARRLETLPKGTLRGAEIGLQKAAVILLQATYKNFTGGSPGSSDPNKITGRSGTMRGALNRTGIEKGPDSVQVRVGYREGKVDQYVKVHEADGPTTMKPRRNPSGVLAIPLPSIMTGAGVPRFQSPRQLKGGHWFVNPKSGKLLFTHPSTGIAFVGKKSVTVKPRRPLMKAMESTRAARSKVIKMEMERAIQAARG